MAKQIIQCYDYVIRHLNILSTVSNAAAFVKNSLLFLKSDTGTPVLIFYLQVKKKQIEKCPRDKQKKRNRGIKYMY